MIVFVNVFSKQNTNVTDDADNTVNATGMSSGLHKKA